VLIENIDPPDNPKGFSQNQNHKSQNIAQSLALSVNDVEINSEMLFWVERLEKIEGRYSQIFAHRTRYVWKWIQTAFQIASLNIPNEHLASAQSLKFRLGFLAVLLDDICDVGKSEQDLQKGLGILMGAIPSKNDDSLYHLIYDLWISISRDIEVAPNYDFFQDEVTLANKKLRDSFSYGLFLPKRLLAGEKVWHFYLEIIPHSICVYLAGLIDLLHVLQYRSIDLEIARHLFENTQKMAQIGNWLSTYERELKQNDISSGIVVWGLEQKWLEHTQFQYPISLEIVRSAIRDSPVEKSLLEMWKTIQGESFVLQQRCDEHTFEGYVESFSKILLMQIGSFGLT
jgi:hypothetical protein